MGRHPLLLILLAWLAGSYFGLQQLLAMFRGARRPMPAGV